MGSEIPAEEVMKRFGADKADYFTDEHPQHRVRLTKSYLLGVHAVTRGEFGRFVREANYKTTAEEKGTGWGWSKEGYKEQAGLTWRNPGFEQTDEHPVVLVSHDDAMAFCKWLSKRTCKTGSPPKPLMASSCIQWVVVVQAYADSSDKLTITEDQSWIRRRMGWKP